MSKEHCCCGNIHNGALIIGFLVLILSIIGLLASVVTVNVQGILSNVLYVIIGGCILYADRYNQPGGYLPYLVFQAIGIIICTVFIVSFFIMAMVVPGTLLSYIHFQATHYGYESQHKDRENTVDELNYMRLVFFYTTVLYALIDWFVIWLWMVVYRAYMKGVEEYERGQTYQVKLNDV